MIKNKIKQTVQILYLYEQNVTGIEELYSGGQHGDAFFDALFSNGGLDYRPYISGRAVCLAPQATLPRRDVLFQT